MQAPLPTANTCAEQLAASFDDLAGLRVRLRICDEERRERERQAAQCEAARARPCTNLRDLPAAVARYEQCYVERPDRPALAGARRVAGWRPADGVAGCAAHARAEGAGRVALFADGCYLVSAGTEAREAVTRHGVAREGACGEAFDERGATLGGSRALALYEALPPPRGVDARYVRIVRPPAANPPGGTPPQIVGMAAYGAPDGRPWPPAAVAWAPPARTNDEYGRLLRGAAGDPAALTAGTLAAVEDGLTLDLGEPRAVTAVVVRNHAVQGDPAVEGRLRGCVVQLWATDPAVVAPAARPLREWRVETAAAEYRFEVAR